MFHQSIARLPLLLPLVLILAVPACAEAAPARPHIILILTDDMGRGDVACYGGKQPTPHLDRMAKEGTRFTQYYSASPICSPSRAGIITGAFPARWRITSFLQTRAGNRGCEQADFLDPAAPSLPRAMKAAGYATAHFGKWHLGGGRDVADAPKFAAYGYDEHAGTYESPEPHPDITATNWIWSPKDKVKRWDRTAFFVDKTLDFLKRHPDQPCFVNLWPDDIHTPWVPQEDAPKGDTQKNLRGVMQEYDRQIGRLLDELKQLGIDEKTLVIFTSDNGALPTFDGSRSAGLRGSKLSLYEGGIRMPFIVRWPGRVPANRVDEKTVIGAVDLLPTLCAIAVADAGKATRAETRPTGNGLQSAPLKREWDGEDLSAALLGKEVHRTKALFWEYGRNDKFFRFPAIARDRSPNLTVRDGQWKLLINADGSGAELYDLNADPEEKENLASANEGRLREMTKRVLDWRGALPRE